MRMAVFNKDHIKTYAICGAILGLCVMIAIGFFSWRKTQDLMDEKVANAQQDIQNLINMRANVIANAILVEVDTAKSTLQTLAQWNDYSKIRFAFPDDPQYNNTSKAQLMHPLGGGMKPMRVESDFYNEDNQSSNIDQGWFYQNKVNVEWTPTDKTDVIVLFLNINPNVCRALNSLLHEDETIPNVNVNYDVVLIPNRINGNLKSADCPLCENKESLCIQNNGTYAFYSIIGSR